MMELSFNVAHVVNYLKNMVNAHCEGDWLWFPEAAIEDCNELTVFDFLHAIQMLEEIIEKGKGTGTITFKEGLNDGI